ncbi:YlxR family protein [Deinococcus radiomollis]|uniref:YlxR family protein n=1 Tax=Deinococcus radiomollis TaxID=468916 RepID=UPI0038915F51
MQTALPVTSPSAVRHVPERSCVACRRRRPQGEFVRLTKVGGVWAIQTGHRSGRGSYLCFDTPACWTEKRMKRMFGAQAATLSAELTARLQGVPRPSITPALE